MLSFMLFIGAIASLFMPGTLAVCEPDWQALASNPVKDQNGNSITTSVYDNVGAVRRGSLAVRLKFLTSTVSGSSVMGLWKLTDGYFTKSAGYAGTATFEDFYLFDLNSVTYMLYVDSTGDDLYLVQQSGDSTTWGTPRLIYSNVATGAIQYPQAAIIGTNIWISIQNQDSTVEMLYSSDDLATINDVGVVTYNSSGGYVKPGAQYSMFAAPVDGGVTSVLWFCFIDTVDELPYVTYALTYNSGVQVDDPNRLGDEALYTSSSVSVIPKASGDQAMMLRVGYSSNVSTNAYAFFTVFELKSGPVQELCEEELIIWGTSSEQVASSWSPALVYQPTTTDSVGLTWASSIDGTLNSIFGTPWSQ